jgi:glycosyltransferase involved in cell wall biosynthesis
VVPGELALDTPAPGQAADGEWPSVSVVLPTYQRPEPLRAALDSVLQQDYPGRLEVLVVFDHTPPDLTLEQLGSPRQVRVLTNARQRGLAGNRNTGILAAESDLIAFLDDDDTWLPGKLTRQVSARGADRPVRHDGDAGGLRRRSSRAASGRGPCAAP